ncbi:PAS domain S-box-containing protein [Rhodothalassium salexigens DSM 2132]|uniref:histidine kinase n=2 Tax=Rhodothalassium salexigens TaxID=1086 RepID=A0A4R2PVV0_RHOSA|nr:hypothetical protein [Rhodothalassium salexigens DSM 2132]TCP38345.1 PAS domain S-box-containing protein [Rhodothalassium salexigens DSM 2132]
MLSTSTPSAPGDKPRAEPEIPAAVLTRLRALAAHMPQAWVALLDADARLFWVSGPPALSALSPAAEALPAELPVCLRGGDRKALGKAAAAVIGGTMLREQVTLSLSDSAGDATGPTVCLEAHLTPAGAEAPDRAVLVGHDITAQFSEIGRFRELAEKAAEGIVVLRDDEVLYANPRMASMLGMSRPEDVQRLQSVSHFVHPDDRAEVMGNIADRMTGRRVTAAPYDFRLVSDKGRCLWVNCHAETILSWPGGPAILASFVDVTARRDADRARTETELLFQRIFELSPEIITLTRFEDGTYRFINDTFTQSLGYRREEVIGFTPDDIGIWSPDNPRERLIACLLRDGTVQDLSMRARRRDGQILDLSVSATTLDYEGDTYILLVAHDATERRRQERQLEASRQHAELANRAKSEFLANMSHELRTPLNAIIGFAEVMQTEAFGPLGTPQYRDYSNDILNAGRHLLSIINEILDLSKLEAGHLAVDTLPVPVGGVFDTCVRLIGEKAQQAGVRVSVKPHDPGLDVLADPVRLKQVMLNLLSNAVKFTPSGGRVEIRAAAVDDEMVEIQVADTGIGMSKADLARAMTPFGQVDSSLSRHHEGTGLGLPLARALIDLQHGTLHLESEPGMGTTATVRLPTLSEKTVETLK